MDSIERLLLPTVTSLVSKPIEPSSSDATRQRWPWWPLLPLYPYGRRRTLIRELIHDKMWSFEQVQGVWYVAVPIRMVVLRVDDGLLIYAPIPPTGEVVDALKNLERLYGAVRTIVLPTASGLEHKIPVPAMARIFPEATVWVTPRQWSYPVRLPPAWVGFPPDRTRVLLEDGVPDHKDLAWVPLGPFDLGLGTFMEVACFDRASGSILITDALVSIPEDPPRVFELDPTPLLFHARDRGNEPLVDTPERRLKGWCRLVLFANYFRPEPLDICSFQELILDCLAPGCRNARSHFGLYPFRWRPEWEKAIIPLIASEQNSLILAPVLQRLVFPRSREALISWIRHLARLGDISYLIPAHYHAPVPTSPAKLMELASRLESIEWVPDSGPWALLSSIDSTLLKFRLVPRVVPLRDTLKTHLPGVNER